MSRGRKLRVLDLFAGAGGFSLGFEQAGCEIVGAIEMDKWASETFKFNHPKSVMVNQDIESVTAEEVSDLFRGKHPDIIIGGPPCQGFSVCNRLNGDPKDPRNSLFQQFVRFGKIFDPQYMVMENVPNLTKAKTENGEKVIDVITREMVSLGYYVYHAILRATDFGIPQIRKRLIVVASKEVLEKPFPEPTHSTEKIDLFNFSLKRTPTLWDAISDLPNIEARGGAEKMQYADGPKNAFQESIRSGSDTLYNHKAMNHSKRMVERFKSMKSGQGINDVPEHLRPFRRNSKGEISEKLYDQNNRRMYPDKPCHTIPASFYANFVHPFSHRNFTAREGARLQTFPDTYVFRGKPTVVSHKLLSKEGRNNEKYLCQYAQIGNAVPPMLSNMVARNLLGEAS